MVPSTPVFVHGPPSADAAATATRLVLTASTPGRALVTSGGGGVAASGITVAELDSLRGATGPIQASLNAVTPSGFSSNRALVSSPAGDVAASSVSATELGFLRGLTSPLTTQLDSFARVVSMPYSWKTNGATLADSPLTFVPDPGKTYLVAAQLLVYADTTGHAVSYGVRWPSPLHSANAGLVTFAFQQTVDTPATLRSSSRVANVPVCTFNTTTLANVPWMLSVRAVFSTAANAAQVTPFAIVANTNNRSRWAHVLYGSHLSYKAF